MNSFYIYAYLDKEKPGKFYYGSYSFDYEPFYIGKGSGDRLYHHLNEAERDKLVKNPHKFYHLRKMLKESNKPIIIKYIDNLTEQEAFKIEENIIRTIGRKDYKEGPLLNVLDGGIGGKRPSPEMRKRRSEWSKGKGNSFYGKKHSKETLNLISKNRSGGEAWNKGISSLSEEAKQKISEANKGHLVGNKNPSKRLEVRDKIGKANTGKNNGNSKSWEVIFKDGKTYKFCGGIKRFCKEHKLNFKKLRENRYENISLICLDD